MSPYCLLDRAAVCIGAAFLPYLGFCTIMERMSALQALVHQPAAPGILPAPLLLQHLQNIR